MPGAFIKRQLFPLILENKNCDSSAKNNYRPIAIVTAMSKLFELCLSRITDAYIFTSDNQFGFKRKHSTDLCIEIIQLNPLYVITIILIVLHILLFLVHLKLFAE